MSTTILSTPERSIQQRLLALQHANEVRSERAVLKRDLKAGRVQMRDLLERPPDYLENAKVYSLLLAMPKVGRVSVDRAFRRAGISPSKTFAGISRRQVDALRAEMRGRV